MASLGRIRTVWGGVAGSPYYTNLWFLTDSGGTGMEDSCDAWTAFIDSLSVNMNTLMTMTVEPDVPIIDSTTGVLTGSTTITPNAVDLDGGGDILPPATQGLFRWTTGFVVAGRRLRGRTYWPGMLEANNTSSGQPSGALTASVNGALATFLAAADVAPLVVYSPTHHAYASVDGGNMWTEWASLRSRRD